MLYQVLERLGAMPDTEVYSGEDESKAKTSYDLRVVESGLDTGKMVCLLCEGEVVLAHNPKIVPIASATDLEVAPGDRWGGFRIASVERTVAGFVYGGVRVRGPSSEVNTDPRLVGRRKGVKT